MTSKHDTGGPAMPHNRSLALCEHCAQEQAHPGMTLLDWFAGQAPEWATAGPHRTSAGIAPGANTEDAFLRYEWAAAMIAEKRKLEGNNNG